MKLHNIKEAFTLIELLVVITIMWILATSAVGIYTTQIKKARDSTRTSDIKAVEQAIMQFYQDKSVYPNTYADWVWSGSSVKEYVQVLPEDPKNGQTCLGAWWAANTVCSYLYSVWIDKNGITNWAYRLSIGFEDSWNLDGRAGNTYDSWIDESRYELWAWNPELPVWLTNLFTSKSAASAASTTIDSDKGITILRWGIGEN
jgi:prepilin-type N-terminal cleavage/methylation domain-containing protein